MTPQSRNAIRQFSILSTTLALLLAAAPQARAETAGEEAAPKSRAQSAGEETAAQKTQQAAALLDAGKPGEALVLFREAYALVPKPTYRYNIAVALQAMQQDTQAYEEFGLFLSEARYYETPGDRVADAEKQRQELAGKFAFIDVAVNKDGAEVVVDDFPRGRSPLRAPVPVLPGSHGIRIEKAGFVTGTQSMTIPAGVTQSVLVALGPQPTPCQLPAPVMTAPVAPPPGIALNAEGASKDTSRGHGKLFWGAIIVGILAVAAGGAVIAVQSR
jgi:hypothetical protein